MIAVNVIMRYAREGLINEILYADDLAVVSGSKDNLRDKLLK